MGRPTKYKPIFCEQMHEMVIATRNGITNKYIANYYQINELTVKKWRKKHPEFNTAITQSKDDLDHAVERSLWERAIGYKSIEVKTYLINGDIVSKEVDKYYPPDPTSMIFWLKNRQRDKWRDTVEAVVKQEVNDISDLEIARTVAFLLTNATQKDPPIKEIN